VPLRLSRLALLDNSNELATGAVRIVHIDYPTQKRTPKASFYCTDLIAAEHNGAEVTLTVDGALPSRCCLGLEYKLTQSPVRVRQSFLPGAIGNER